MVAEDEAEPEPPDCTTLFVLRFPYHMMPWHSSLILLAVMHQAFGIKTLGEA